MSDVPARENPVSGAVQKDPQPIEIERPVSAREIFVSVSGEEVRTSRSRNEPAASSEPFRPPIDLTKLLIEYAAIDQWMKSAVVSLSQAGLLDINSTESERARILADILFASLFPKDGSGREVYRDSLYSAQSDNLLRIWLSVPTDLSVVPWELLWSSIDQLWRATEPRWTLLRTPERCDDTTYNLLDREGPLRVVVATAGPRRAVSPAAHDEIAEHINELKVRFDSLQNSQAIEFEGFEGLNTRARIEARLRQSKPIHILHLFCRGDITENGHELLLAGAQANDVDRVPSFWLRNELRRRLREFPDQRIQLVILNICYSARALPHKRVNSLAAEIIREGVPAVVAMQCKLSPGMVNMAMPTFYDAILNAEGIDRAIYQARRDLYNHFRSRMDWAIPVLFVHPGTQELRLFSSAQPRSIQGTNGKQSKPILSQGITREVFFESQGIGSIGSAELFFSPRSERLRDEFPDIFVEGTLKVNRISELRNFFLFAPQGYGKTGYRIRAELEAAKTALVVNVDFGAFSELGHPPLQADYLDRIKRATYEKLKPSLSDRVRLERVRQDEEAAPIFDILKQKYGLLSSAQGSVISPKGQTQGQVDEILLRNFLAKHYDKEELRELCFELKIDYEAIGGQGVRGKARELVAYAQRRGRYDELIEICRRNRPNVNWIDQPQTSSRQSQLITEAIDTSGVDFRAWIQGLANLVVCAGFRGLHLTFDGLDKLVDKAPTALEVLAPLLERPEYLDVPNSAFKFFLPDDPYLQEKISKLLKHRRDDFQIYELERWTPDQLRLILNRRLQHYAHKAEIPDQIDRFRQLCESDVKADIEMDLCAAADGSPRVLIQLVEEIVKQHCSQVSDGRTLIPRRLIEQVLGG